MKGGGGRRPIQGEDLCQQGVATAADEGEGLLAKLQEKGFRGRGESGSFDKTRTSGDSNDRSLRGGYACRQ